MTRDENRDGCGAVLGWALRILGLAGVCVPALEVTAPLFTAPGINFPRYINIANQQMANHFKFLRTKDADAILTHTMLTKSVRCPTTTKQIQPDEEIVFARNFGLPKDLFSQDD
jgi:hypothetical protein